ncbi:hypothetical protein FQN55_007411 [Onygenales sp. PD_40]|nr:hypothetical protein FQN55_007411 [Onygenales sp. PD_40]
MAAVDSPAVPHKRQNTTKDRGHGHGDGHDSSSTWTSPPPDAIPDPQAPSTSAPSLITDPYLRDATELDELGPPSPQGDRDNGDGGSLHLSSASTESVSSGSVRMVVQRTRSSQDTRRSLEGKGPLPSLRRYWSRQVSLTVAQGQNRDHFALERTYLAYIRTSLAFAFLGVLIAQLFSLQHRTTHSPRFGFYSVGMPLACACHGCAMVLAAVGAHRFWRQQNALARGKVHAGGWELNVTVTLFVLVILISRKRLDD